VRLLTLVLGLFVAGQSAAKEQEVLYSFENWKISHLSDNKSYILRGTATGTNSGFFEYQCFEDNLQETISFPIFKKANSKKTDLFYVWNENGPKRLELAIYENALAFGIFETDRESVAATLKEKDYIRMSAWMFVETLRTSNKEFGFGQGEASLTFDTKFLKTALVSFSELCFRKRSPR
jgi:hypothetical protein